MKHNKNFTRSPSITKSKYRLGLSSCPQTIVKSKADESNTSDIQGILNHMDSNKNFPSVERCEDINKNNTDNIKELINHSQFSRMKEINEKLDRLMHNRNMSNKIMLNTNLKPYLSRIKMNENSLTKESSEKKAARKKKPKKATLKFQPYSMLSLRSTLQNISSHNLSKNND